MFNAKDVLKGGVMVVALASLAAPQAAKAQHHSPRHGGYTTTYVEYQPTHYAPVHTNRPVVYTAPVYQAPVREVVRYVPQPVRTRTVYVQPRRDYHPRPVVYRSGHGYGHNRSYGYRTGYRGSHGGVSYYRSRGRHGSRGFRVDIGGVHVAARSGRHGGVSVRVGH